MKKVFVVVVTVIVVVAFVLFFWLFYAENDMQESLTRENQQQRIENDENITDNNRQHPMSISSLQSGNYPSGNFVTEEKLSDGVNHERYIVSYRSEGLKIYGLFTIPKSPMPENRFPAVLFMHGYIPPDRYSTVDNYKIYQAALARTGFVTFKPDLRGHGNSDGDAVSAHFSEKYVIDAFNALAHMKSSEYIDPKRIGYWGHSNGGEIGLRMAVSGADIKAYVFWAGVVGSFEDMLETYNDRIPFLRNADDPLITEHGLPRTNEEFWRTIDPYAHLDNVTVPVQIHHGTDDPSVPIELSAHLDTALREREKSVEFFQYEGDDHNIGKNYSLAWQRTIEFFNEHL